MVCLMLLAGELASLAVQASMFWRSRSGRRRGPTRVACLVRDLCRRHTHARQSQQAPVSVARVVSLV